MLPVPPRRLVLLFSAVVIYLTLFYQLGNLHFIGADEPRYARIAEEMNLRGEYVTPTLHFRPWLEKPPLLFWLEAGSFALFGVSEWSARFPVALLALLGILASVWLVYGERRERAALLTGLILATSGLYFLFGRAASTDMPLASLLAAAMASGFRSLRASSVSLAAASGLFLALACLAKGPVAALLFGGTLLFYVLLAGWRRQNWRACGAGLVVFAAVVTPWFWQVWVENQYAFLATFWINHHLARFVTPIHHHVQPFWYYLPLLLVGFFPWVFSLGSAAIRFYRRRLWQEGGLELFLWIWALLPLIFFSASQSKLPGYILPMIPPLAMLTALEWDRYLTGHLSRYRLLKLQMALLTALALLLSLVLVFGFHFIYRSAVLGLLVGGPLAAGALWAHWEFRKQRMAAAFVSLVAGMALAAALCFWQAAPRIDDYHSAAELSRVAAPWISEQEPLILYRYFHHTAGYYTGYRTTRQALPDLGSLREYLQAHPQASYWILTQKPGWEELRDSTSAELFRQQGNLYLVRLSGPEAVVFLGQLSP